MKGWRRGRCFPKLVSTPSRVADRPSARLASRKSREHEPPVGEDPVTEPVSFARLRRGRQDQAVDAVLAEQEDGVRPRRQYSG